MSYCRFTNTKSDLIDCRENLWDEVSSEEARARKVLIEICKDIASQFETDEDIDRLPVEKDE